MANAISLSNVIAGYVPTKPVLRGINLDIPEGQFCSVLGASGSGKSTLLRIIAGLASPLSGSVRIDDRPVEALPLKQRKIGFVFQELALFGNLTVSENIGFGLPYAGLDPASCRTRIHEVLTNLGLSEQATKKPRHLSGGQKQRVALGRALASAPRILLLDEPFSSLDRPLTDVARGLVVRLHRESRLTTILVTHDRDQALSISDRIVVLGRDGTIHHDGTPSAVYECPRTYEAAALTGVINELPGTVVTMANGMLSVRVEQAVVQARWMGERLPPVGGQVKLAFRPEWAGLALDEERDSGAAQASLQAIINHVTQSGNRRTVHCSLNGFNVAVEGESVRLVAPGQKLSLQLSENKTLAYPITN